MTDEPQFCCFTLDGHLYGVEVARVGEVLPAPAVTPLPWSPPPVLGLINLRGGLVAALDPRPCLGLAGPRRTPAGGGVLVRTDRGPVLLVIDRVEDVRTVPRSAFEPAPPTAGGLGDAALGGAFKVDRLLLILDVDRLAESAAAPPEFVP